MTTLITLLLLPLENGDKLTFHEFERRYNAMPHVKKAELIAEDELKHYNLKI